DLGRVRGERRRRGAGKALGGVHARLRRTDVCRRSRRELRGRARRSLRGSAGERSGQALCYRAGAHAEHARPCASGESRLTWSSAEQTLMTLDRREFIKTAGSAAVASALASCINASRETTEVASMSVPEKSGDLCFMSARELATLIRNRK